MCSTRKRVELRASNSCHCTAMNFVDLRLPFDELCFNSWRFPSSFIAGTLPPNFTRQMSNHQPKPSDPMARAGPIPSWNTPFGGSLPGSPASIYCRKRPRTSHSYQGNIQSDPQALPVVSPITRNLGGIWGRNNTGLKSYIDPDLEYSSSAMSSTQSFHDGFSGVSRWAGRQGGGSCRLVIFQQMKNRYNKGLNQLGLFFKTLDVALETSPMSRG